MRRARAATTEPCAAAISTGPPAAGCTSDASQRTLRPSGHVSVQATSSRLARELRIEPAHVQRRGRRRGRRGTQSIRQCRKDLVGQHGERLRGARHVGRRLLRRASIVPCSALQIPSKRSVEMRLTASASWVRVRAAARQVSRPCI